MFIITDGQARRIAAEWHAPGTEMSRCSHTGQFDLYALTNEIDAEVARLANFGGHGQPASYVESAKRDLNALRRWATDRHYHATVGGQGWSSRESWNSRWDDTPVPVGSISPDLER
jgi:hypothetical protein